MGIRIALKAFPADVLTELNQLWIHEWLRSISLRTRKEVVSFRVFFFRRVYFSKESLEKKKNTAPDEGRHFNTPTARQREPRDAQTYLGYLVALPDKSVDDIELHLDIRPSFLRQFRSPTDPPTICPSFRFVYIHYPTSI